jgi:hypothetical protein
MSGTPVQIWDCNGTDAQKWTYDPIQKVLQSALGTVAGVEDGKFSEHALILMAWPVDSFPPGEVINSETGASFNVHQLWQAAVPVIDPDQGWHADDEQSVIFFVYQAVLHRSPTDAEYRRALAYLQDGGTQQGLRGRLVARLVTVF